MGRHHYSSAHWQDVSSTLCKMTQWERRSSLISSPEVYSSNQHVATSLLAVVTIWWIMRGRKKQNFSFKRFFLISLISSGVLQHSKAASSWHEYNTGHISILPKFIGNLLQVWRNCHMGCLEYYSLLGLAHCSGHLILLLLLCGDVEVNPGPYEEGVFEGLDKTMQKTVDHLENISLVVGGGGVGKTHLMALSLKLKPPSLRISTPCAEIPPFVLLNIQVHQGVLSYEVLTEEMYSTMMMKSRNEDKSCLSPDSDQMKSPIPSSKNPSSRKLTYTDVDMQLIAAGSRNLKDVKSLDNKVLGRIIDIGGHPQLLELLPRFISGISLGVVVTDLSQDLADYPISYFYGDDGKSVGKGIKSSLTNEQIIRVFLQMIVSQSTKQKKVNVMIVGTHKDVEHKSKETRKKKEEKLKYIVTTFGLEKNIIYTDETHASIIFAVNALHPEEEDYAIGQKIMEETLNEKDAQIISIPIKHHNLELTLKKLSKPKRVAIPIEEVFQHVRHYYKTCESMKEGLVFLHRSFRIFYFKEFPDIVFGEPQLLLNFMTRVTVYHIKLTTNPDQATTSTGTWKQFKEQGIITEAILVHICNVFDDVLTPRHMIEVMEKLLIACMVGDGEYLMPSLLTTLATLPLAKPSLWLRWLPSKFSNYLSDLISGLTSDVTMLLHFPLGLVRFGVYCSTVCKLISNYNWKLTGAVSRNKFCFSRPLCAGRVALIDSFDSFFIVNLDVPSNFPSKSLPDMCSEVRDTLLTVIHKVTNELKYSEDQPMVSFICKRHCSTPHAAAYDKTYQFLLCTKDYDVINEIQDNHRLWLNRNENDQSCINANDVKSMELIEISTATGHSDTIPPIMASDASSECEALFQAKNILATTEMREEYETLIQKVPGSHLSYLDDKVEIGISLIANKLAEWKSKTSLFGISKEEVKKSDSNSGETFLEMWKNKTSCCTYRRLLCICVAGNWSEAANTIVDIVSGKNIILSDVVKGMSSKEEIDRNTAQILVVGFPGVGKSSLIHNLLNRSQKPIGSTNVVEESHVIVDVGTEEPTHSVALVHCEDTKSKYSWKEIKYKDYLVRLLNEKATIHSAVTKDSGTDHHTDDEVDDSKNAPYFPNMKNINDDNNGSDAHAKPKDNTHLEADNGTTTDVHTQTLSLEPSLHQSMKEVKVSQKHVSEDKSSQIQDQASQAQDQNSSIKEANLVESTRIAGYITELLDGISFENLKKSSSIYIWDTGGQLEFQEILSILLSGPSIVIFVLKTTCPMNIPPIIDYWKNDKIINKYKTVVTPNEALLQTLASIDAMQKQDVNSKVPDCQADCQVLIVGTHIDCLKDKKEINSINEGLDKLLCEHGFNSLVKYKSIAEKTVMYTVNNESQIDTEFQCLRKTITDILNNKVSSFNITYRIKDLLFCLNLNQTGQKTILGYDEFVTMAKEFGIHNDDEIENLLNFLHNKVGVIRYYNVEGDKFIICQPHVLFSIVTNVIVETFVDSNCYSRTDRTNLMEKGVITAKTLLEILKKEMEIMKSSSEFNPNRFLELLKFLRIVVSYKDDNNDEMCFLPTALNHAAEDEEDEIYSGETLYIAFACKYCPKGLFIVLIAHLMDQKRNTESITLKLKPHKVSRNKVFFIVKFSNGDIIKAQMSVKGLFSHIEVKLYFMDSDNESNKEKMCSGVQENIMHSIEESLKSCNYNSSRVKAYPGYKCKDCKRFCQIFPNKTRIKCEPCWKTTPLPSGVTKFFAQGLKCSVLSAVDIPFKQDRLLYSWDDHGFEIIADNDSIPKELTESCISVSAISSDTNFILTDNFKFISSVFYIDFHHELTKPVIIRIQHCAANASLNGLRFAISSDKSPPYRFKYDKTDEKFCSKYGERAIQSSSFFCIIQCVPELRPSTEVLYSVSLYYHYQYDDTTSKHYWEIYLFVVKKLNTTEECVDEYVENMPEKWLKYKITVVEFTEGDEVLDFKLETTEPADLRVCKHSHLSVKKSVLDMYVNGEPPSCRLQIISSQRKTSRIEIKFVMEGIKEPNNFITFIWMNPETPTSEQVEKLSSKDLKDVLRFCNKARSNWYNIGLELDISDDDLDAIDTDNQQDSSKCLRKMLQHWLRSDLDRTWKSLANALGSNLVQQPSLGSKILEKYKIN